MAAMGSASPSPAKYTPRRDLAVPESARSRAPTFTKATRFQSPRARQASNSQVSPATYSVNDYRNLSHQVNGLANRSGIRFQKDQSERLTSSRYYLPSRDVTPAPTETDRSYLDVQKSQIKSFLRRTSIDHVARKASHRDFNSQVRQKNMRYLPLLEPPSRRRVLDEMEKTNSEQMRRTVTIDSSFDPAATNPALPKKILV